MLRKMTINIGTKNAQSKTGKMETKIQETKKMEIDIIALTDTEKKRNGTEILDEYPHIFSRVPNSQRAIRGVSIMINKRHKHKILCRHRLCRENLIVELETI